MGEHLRLRTPLNHAGVWHPGSIAVACGEKKSARPPRLPPDEIIWVVNQDNFVFVEHWHQDMFQFALPKFSFIKLRFHRLTRFKIGKTSHKKECVWVFDR